MLLNNLDVLDYRHYYENNMLKRGLDLNIPRDYNFSKKYVPLDPLSSVTLENQEKYPPEYDDLVRLHYAVTRCKALTVVEIGSGSSTPVIAHAVLINMQDIGDISNLRKPYAGKVFTVDTSEFWLNETLKLIPTNLQHCIMPIVSGCSTHLIDDRISTLFDNFPNISADFYYVDGPHNMDSIGSVAGQSTRDPSRMPMIADLVISEFFLHPGCIIYVDGRTANARFMRKCFKQNWIYRHFNDLDVHIFELSEQSLGIFNTRDLIKRGLAV
jgi:hypothetical protein